MDGCEKIQTNQTEAEVEQQCRQQNIDLVLRKMWSFARFYKVADASGKGVEVVWCTNFYLFFGLLKSIDEG
jgi:hypothetical protein